MLWISRFITINYIKNSRFSFASDSSLSKMDTNCKTFRDGSPTAQLSSSIFLVCFIVFSYVSLQTSDMVYYAGSIRKRNHFRVTMVELSPLVILNNLTFAFHYNKCELRVIVLTYTCTLRLLLITREVCFWFNSLYFELF